jgi:membrane dipeptidase
MGVTNSRNQRIEEPYMADLMAVDLHGDILLDVVERRTVHEETTVLLERHYEALQAGKVKVQVLPVYVEARYQPESSLRIALLQIASLFRELEEGRGEFVQIFNSADLEKVLESQVIGLILAFEGAEPLGRDIELLSVFYELGLRMVGMTWNRANLLAQGIAEDTGAGLSSIGRRLVDEMGKLGIILDLSHLSVRSFWDALEYSSSPVLASHSNCATVWEHPRNLTDDQIKGIAERGGIIGLNFLPEFVGRLDVLDGLVDHAAHIASLVGVRHVALGPDFINYLRYMGETMPVSQIHFTDDELEQAAYNPSVRLLPEFYRALIKRGFSETDARSIAGENAVNFLMANL